MTIHLLFMMTMESTPIVNRTSKFDSLKKHGLDSTPHPKLGLAPTPSHGMAGYKLVSFLAYENANANAMQPPLQMLLTAGFITNLQSHLIIKSNTKLTLTGQ